MGAHTNALRSAQIGRAARSKAVIELGDEFDTPSFREAIFVLERRDRMLESKKRREQLAAQHAAQQQAKAERQWQVTCAICPTREASRDFWQIGLLHLDDMGIDISRGYVRLCTPCFLQLSRIRKAAIEADELRLSINRTKRKIYEATKDHA